MKTAVEWLVEEMFKQGYLNDKPLTIKNIESFVKQANKMFEEQIIDAYRINPNNENWSNSGIDYYNETFKSE